VSLHGATDAPVAPPGVQRHAHPLYRWNSRNVGSLYGALGFVKSRPTVRRGNGHAGKRCGRKRKPRWNGAERGSHFALTRKGADFPQVSQDEPPLQTCTLDTCPKGNLVLQAANGIIARMEM